MAKDCREFESERLRQDGLMVAMKAARDVARWRSETNVWLDHTKLVDRDLDWLERVDSVTAWAVETPDRFWSRLPGLVRLDIRGGSGSSIDIIDGCEGLQWLAVNQVRGVTDLGALQRLTALRFLLLFGLPRVEAFPSLAPLIELQYVEIGSMAGLRGLAGLLDAPNIEELTLSRRIGLSAEDPESVALHPTIRAFAWNGDGAVPDKTWVPVVDRIGKPTPQVNNQTWPLPARFRS